MDLSLYWAILISSVMYTDLDIRFVHQNYNLKPFDKLVMFLHAIIMMYLVIGVIFLDRRDIFVHLFTLIGIMILWQANNHCVLSMYMEKSVDYSDHDYDRIIMKYPDRLNFHLSVALPILLIDAIKLIYISK